MAFCASIEGQWDDAKKAGFVEHVATKVKEAGNREASDPVLHREIYELLHLFLSSKIKDQDLGNALKDLSAKIDGAQLEECVADLVWLVGEEVVDGAGKEELRPKIAPLVNQIIIRGAFCHVRPHVTSDWRQTSGAAKEDVLKERVSEEVLQEATLIKSAADARSRLQRLRTGKVYSQQKFNLLREESEGYSKLVVELEQGQGLTTDNVERVSNNVQALIAYFNLDPNRVLDVMLDCYESSLSQPLYCHLVRKFCPTSLIHVVGFKFQGYQQAGQTCPSSLYHLAAALCAEKVLDVRDLYPHLAPADAEASKEMDGHWTATVAAVKKMRVFTLSKMEDGTDKDEQPFDAAPHARSGADNQKLHLTAALVAAGDWASASYMLEAQAALLPASFPPVAHALCGLVHQTLEPLYAQHLKATGLAALLLRTVPTAAAQGAPQLSNLDELAAVAPMLSHLSVYLHLDPVLFVKLCRLLKAHVGQLAGATPPDYVREMLVVLLSSLALLPCNAALSCELWECLRPLPYLDRYWVYAEVHWRVYAQHPQLVLERARCREEMRKLLKGMTKENVNKKKRVVGRLSHANPLVVVDFMLDQVQEYESMIEVCKESLFYFTSLSLDVWSFLVVEEIGGSLQLEKPMLQDDCANLARWVLNLSSFVSDVYVKHPRSEMRALLQHVFNRLNRDSFGELVLLRDLVWKMSGIKYEAATVSNEDIASRAGGERLRVASENPWPVEVLFEAGNPDMGRGGGAARIKQYFVASKERREATEALLDALETSNLLVPFLLSITQQTWGCMFTKEAEKMERVKYSSWLHRQCQETLLVYCDLLSRRVPTDKLQKLMPTPTDLVQQLQLDPAMALFVLRPLLHRDPTSDKPPVVDLQQHAKELLAAMPNPPKVSSVSLYSTFWSLQLQDIWVPSDVYDSHIQRLKKALKDLEDTDRVDPKAKDKDIRKWRDGITQDMQKLEAELKRQQEAKKQVAALLETEKGTWSPQNARNFPLFILQTCVLPRCVLSAEDAVYCAKFLHLLHSLRTPKVSTILIYNLVVTSVGPMVFSRTEHEAKHLGKFLAETLQVLNEWARSEAKFKKECAGTPGFMNSHGPKGSSRENALTMGQYTVSVLTLDGFQSCNRNWHKQLCKAFCHCLDSEEGTEVHNALTILSELVGTAFPMHDTFHGEVRQRVAKLTTDSNHSFGNSITVMARSINARLQQCEDSMVKLNVKAKKTDSKAEPKTDAKAEAKGESKAEAKSDGKDKEDGKDKGEGKGEKKAEGKAEKKPEGKSTARVKEDEEKSAKKEGSKGRGEGGKGDEKAAAREEKKEEKKEKVDTRPKDKKEDDKNKEEKEAGEVEEKEVAKGKADDGSGGRKRQRVDEEQKDAGDSGRAVRAKQEEGTGGAGKGVDAKRDVKETKKENSKDREKRDVKEPGEVRETKEAGAAARDGAKDGGRVAGKSSRDVSPNIAAGGKEVVGLKRGDGGEEKREIKRVRRDDEGKDGGRAAHSEEPRGTAAPDRRNGDMGGQGQNRSFSSGGPRDAGRGGAGPDRRNGDGAGPPPARGFSSEGARREREGRERPPPGRGGRGGGR